MRCPSDEDLALYASGVDLPVVAAHEVSCPLCSTVVANIRASDDLAPMPTAPAPATTEPGTSIGRFVVLGQLGRGGMGEVFLAYDPLRDRTVALKSTRLEEGVRSSDRVRRFKREFRIARDLHHPNVVRLGELFEDRGRWCFTMEVIQGVELLRYVRGGGDQDAPTRTATPDDEATRDTAGGAASVTRHAGTCDVDKLRATTVQLAHALDAMHRAGLVHRDVKPSNVLVEGDGRVVLVDFGIAVDREDALLEERRVVGTVTYMAPEQVRGETAGPAADWYALGVVLFVALTGEPPFRGAATEVMAAKTRADGPKPSSRMPDVPPDLDRLCERLLSLEPSMRPTADTVLQVLGEASTPTEQVRTTFVGREALVHALAADAATRSREPVVVTLEGESGIGKTTVVTHAVAASREADPSMLVLRGRCDERESIPFNAIDGVIDDLARHLARVDELERTRIAGRELADLARMFPSLPVDPPPAAAVAEPIAARRRAFAALREVLRRVTDDRRVVIVIDDVQWADADSIAALEAVLEPAAPPIVLLATARSSTAQPWQPPACFAGATRHRLGGLEPEALRAMATAFGRDEIDVARLHAETGGNPMLLEQWMSLPGSEGKPPPAAFDAVVSARVARLSGEAATVLETVAVAGRAIPERAATRAAGLRPDRFDAALAELAAARFARRDGLRTDTVDVSHARIREHVYASLEPTRRRGLHAGVADALIAVGGPPDWIASQLAHAGQPARAASHARAAASAAERSLAFDRATALYRMAIDGAPSAEIPTLRAHLGNALAKAGRPEEAAEAFLAAAAVTVDAAERLELRRRAAEQFLAGGYLHRGLREADELLAETEGGRMPTSDAGAVIALLSQRARLALKPMRWTPTPESEIPRAVLTRLDLHWSLSIGLAWVDSLRGGMFGTRLPLLCLPHGEELRIARALCSAAVAYSALGLPRPARRMVEASERAAQGHGSTLARFYAGLGRLSVEFLLENDWRATIDRTTELAALWRSAGGGGGWESDILEQFTAFAGFWLGRFRAVQARVDALADSAADAGNRFQEVGLRAYFGVLDALLGDPELCERRVALALERAQGDRANLNYTYWAARSRTYAAMYRGDAAARAHVLDPAWRQLERSLLLRVPTVAAEAYAAIGGYQLTCAVLARDASERRARLAAARRVAKRVRHSPLAAGRMTYQNLAAGIAYAAGDHDEAIRLLRTAEAMYVEAGMEGQVAAVRLQLARLVGGDEGQRLRTDALAWFARERIPDPERTAAALCAGWHPDAPSTS